jgi:2-oxoglutarate ferredoxin oxidoreductase subunit alpha
MPGRSPRCSTSTWASSVRCSTRSSARSPSCSTSNHTAIKLGYDYAKAHFTCPLPFRLEKMDATSDHPHGRQRGGALGAVYAGATVGAWYPITPATALMEAVQGVLREVPRGQRHGAAQLRDPAGRRRTRGGRHRDRRRLGGARAFTNTSGPGISLMQEFIGLAYYTDIPAVFFDVQRCGPATGMPTRTQQADLSRWPTPRTATPNTSCSSRPTRASASRWRCSRSTWPSASDAGVRGVRPRHRHERLDGEALRVGRCNYRPDRGKVLDAEALSKVQKFSRYLDVDGDGIAARTLPGVGGKGAYFVRGSGHDKHAAYTEDSDAYQEVVDRLKRKFDARGDHRPAPVISAVTAPRWGW